MTTSGAIRPAESRGGARGAATIVAVDVGNTSTTLGLARGDRIVRRASLPTRATRRADAARALARLTAGRRPDGAMLCSVVPRRNACWRDVLRRLTGRPPGMVTCRLRHGLKLAYPHPATIGADRLANACGAAARYGGSVIVADFGTALTFDVIHRGAYLGGVIAPGLPLMTDYLAERTALLPVLDVRRFRGLPRDPRRAAMIGKSTRQAMAIGARVGYLGMVRELLGRLRAALGGRGVRCCATGGYAAWALAGGGLRVRLDPDLTLYGIARLYALNAARPARAAGGRRARRRGPGSGA